MVGVLADIDDVAARTEGLGTVVLMTIGLLVIAWAVIVWVRARRHSRDGRSARD
jgi:hypothetical protein